MQLTTNSSTPMTCWLVLEWKNGIHELRSYWSMCLTTRVNFPINLNYFVLFQIFCLQGMQLTINSSATRYVDRHDDGIVEFVSLRSFVWCAYPHITLSDQVFITHMGKDLIEQVVDFFWPLNVATVLVAKWFRSIFEPPVQSKCSRYPTNSTKITSKERS